MMQDNARAAAVALIQELWPGAVVLEDGSLRGQLRAAWKAGYKLRLRQDGSLKLTPGARYWPQRWYRLVEEREVEIRALLEAARATKGGRDG